jgi:hypothetical protein
MLLVDLASFVQSFVQALPTFVAYLGGRSQLLRVGQNVGEDVLHLILSAEMVSRSDCHSKSAS